MPQSKLVFNQLNPLVLSHPGYSYNVFPLLLSMSLLANHLTNLLVLPLRQSPVSTAKNQIRIPPLPALTICHTMLMTVLFILAVDFQYFRRTFGVSFGVMLMTVKSVFSHLTLEKSRCTFVSDLLCSHKVWYLLYNLSKTLPI